MTVNGDLALVLSVACLTEDRGPDEQRALLRTALRLDLDLGAFVVPNAELQRPRWVREVAGTYEPSDGKRVTLAKFDLDRYQRLTEKWKLCEACGYPMGGHYDDDRCPTLAIDRSRLDAALLR